MKTLTKKVIFIGCFISVLLLGTMLYLIPISNHTKFSSNKNDINTQENINSSQFVNRKIRIAIYNEPNLTLPAYVSTTEFLHNSYSDIKVLLESMGHQVSELTCNDIYTHKLKTINYDVFLMVDNLPKSNIINQVKEFWLGGGGVLSFGGAIGYLCYAGILPPESLGDEGYSTYWLYSIITKTQNITARHPVTKSYQINDKFTATTGGGSSRNYFLWNAMQATSVASEIIKLANEDGYNNRATVVAFDPIKKGGRVVQMPGDGDPLNSNMNNLIIDAVDWLCPRPKGHILFDLSHKPVSGIDPWDSIYAQGTTTYSLLRNNLVNRSYTFDKLYPSIFGNLTSVNLAKYDLLIELFPDKNFTALEVSVVSNWVDSGGALLAIGDYFSLDQSKNINYLLSNTDLSIYGSSGSSTINFVFDQHPTQENCIELIAVAPGLINCMGVAYPIWGSDTYHINIAAQEYGNGRIILIADTAILRDTYITSEDNLRYGINVVNWLTACQAEVLVYVDDTLNSDNPNDNLYKGPVATALNNLKIKFYLTFNNTTYFNLNLAEKDWTLVVIDCNFMTLLYDYDEILDYVKNGGKLIIREFNMCHPNAAQSPLWQYLGFTPNYTTISSNPPIINLWNDDHPIFKTPANYRANNFTSSLNLFEIDFCYVELHSNATAIAGLGTTQHNEKGAIILSKNGRIITNTMALTEYYDDTDDSTYPDALEIWENEIAFLMPSSIGPGVSSGGDDDGDDGDDGDAKAIPFGNFYLLFTIIAVISLILITKRRVFLSRK